VAQGKRLKKPHTTSLLYECYLNIANKEKKKILKCLEIEKPNTAEIEEIFNLLCDVCMVNLLDTAIRLKTSEFYQDYMAIRATHQELNLSF